MANSGVDTKNWMRDLPSQVKAKPIRDIAIPGTHDSGSYDLDINGPFAPSIPSIVSCLSGCCCCCCNCVKRIVRNWSLTQDPDFKGQLEAGSRFLDIRTAYTESFDEFNIVHGLYGVSLTTAFSQIKQFGDAHPNEVIILDFLQFYEFNPDIHKRFANLVKSTFGNAIAFASLCDQAESTLESLMNKSFQFIVVYHNEATATEFDYWNGDQIFLPFPDTASESVLIQSLNERFTTLKPGILNMFQAILTPQASTVIFNPCGSIKTTLAKDGNKAVKKWLADVKSQNKPGVNIVLIDYLGLNIHASDVIALN